ncbi:ead/Ea22-like family protein [Enterobacter hormaechei]|uniref:ead/Ea22-like family protein n=1 Tax=Enterobacter hormaechei TaxID=158836 RepID=UPI0038BED847
MSIIDKRVLREAAVRAGGVKWQYMRATQHSKAYITDDKGSTVVNCTDGDVPAKCAGFLESANPAAVLALLDELEAAESGFPPLTVERLMRDKDALEKRVVELEARMVKLPERYEVDMCPTPSPNGDWFSREDVLAALLSADVSYAAGNGKGE